MNKIEKLLIEEYSKIFSQKDNRPEWAVKKHNNNELVHPSIPFVGKNYNKTKTLLYASAENLRYYINSNEKSDILENNKIAINRHRYSFDNYNSSDRFFPFVHIAPIEDGSLLTVASYILNNLINIHYKNPYDLADSISLANFGKFSIETKGKNIDYANKYKFLKYSLPYVKADISILKPEIIIMPVKIYEIDEIQKMIYEILPNVTVIPIYQVNARNINAIKRPIFRKYPKKEISEIKDFYEWQKKLSNGITGKTNENFLSVYTYIDKVLENLK